MHTQSSYLLESRALTLDQEFSIKAALLLLCDICVRIVAVLSGGWVQDMAMMQPCLQQMEVFVPIPVLATCSLVWRI